MSPGQAPLEHRVVESLAALGHTLATAESCTGGLVSARITDVPGASAVFLEGTCTYSRAAKERLGVPADVIDGFGEVSAEVAISLAREARARAGADYGIGVTGIAGPGGGSKEKPVGLVFIALAATEGVKHERHLFHGDRREVRERSAEAALAMLMREIATSA